MLLEELHYDTSATLHNAARKQCQHSACQAGAFCWPSRATARCQPKSADPRETSRVTCQLLQAEVTSQSLSVTRSCCCPIKCRDRRDLTVPATVTFLLLGHEILRQSSPLSCPLWTGAYLSGLESKQSFSWKVYCSVCGVRCVVRVWASIMA